MSAPRAQGCGLSAGLAARVAFGKGGDGRISEASVVVAGDRVALRWPMFSVRNRLEGQMHFPGISSGSGELLMERKVSPRCEYRLSTRPWRIE